MKTCTVVLRLSLPHGMIVKPPALAYDSAGQRPPVFRLMPGANDSVPYDVMRSWLKENENLAIVRNRQVFIVEDSDPFLRALECKGRLCAL